MAITRKKIKNSMVITRGDIERHRMKFTYKMVITCEITALLSVGPEGEGVRGYIPVQTSYLYN